MIFWLIKFEEDLPIDKDFYPFRMSMLAESLLKNGHQVVRWASDFNHKMGEPRFNRRHFVELSPSYRIELLANKVSYGGSHSIKRVLSIYVQSVNLFKNMLSAKPMPDAVIVSMPAPITCFLTALFCKIKKIPFFVDARDMWPDILFDELNGLKKVLAFPVYLLMRLELIFACKWAHGLIGITEPFKDYLLEHADRPSGPNDAHFPLGFKQIFLRHDEVAEVEFWQAKGVTFDAKTKLIYFAGTLNKTVLVEAQKVAQAMKEVETRGLPVKLIMCGKGNSELAIKALFKGATNVVFPGHISTSHLSFLKSRSSIALLAIEARKDYLNSLSNKFFDYASGGLPIVTNLGGEPKSVLQKNNAGLYYESSTDLVQILMYLVKDKRQLFLYSQNARNMYENEFEANKVYNDYVKHLEASLS